MYCHLCNYTLIYIHNKKLFQKLFIYINLFATINGARRILASFLDKVLKTAITAQEMSLHRGF